ncbi:unnamed protein product [Rhodiola kirilowii]
MVQVESEVCIAWTTGIDGGNTGQKVVKGKPKSEEFITNAPRLDAQ